MWILQGFDADYPTAMRLELDGDGKEFAHISSYILRTGEFIRIKIDGTTLFDKV